MAVDKFSFGAPSVQINEVDQSVTNVTVPVATGPVIIGRTAKGPSMVPVQVNSLAELEQKFGLPENGKKTVTDAWRTGGVFAPTYATYAAKAFLQNSAPVTVIRLAGLSNGTSALAGWKIEDGNETTTPSAASGAYGLYVIPYNTSTDQLVTSTSGSLAAIIYTSGSIPKLVGNDGPSFKKFVEANDSDEFKLVIDSATDVTHSINIHDATAASFIRNKLNTNPTALEANKYWLGETFEGYIKDTYTTALNTTNVKLLGIIMPLQSSISSKNLEARSSVTPWVVSQYDGEVADFTAGTYGTYPVQSLFRFHTLDIGDSAQKSIKVSVENIKLSPNTVVNPWCSFTVSVRSIATDAVLERFSDVNLNPDSPRYLGKVVGDTYKTFDPDLEKFLEHGQYPNRSSYVRVEISDSLNAGHVPCGFYLPPTFGNEQLANNSGTKIRTISKNASLTFETVNFGTRNNFPVVHPKVKCRSTNEGKTLSRVRWGLQVNSTYNKDLVDHSRIKTTEQSDYVPTSDNNLVYPAIFTLQEIVYAAATNTATWTVGSLAGGTSYYAASAGANQVLGEVLDLFNSFDVPFYGGFEGVDITEKEPFLNNVSLADNKTVTNDSAYYTISTAIDMLADPEMIETDLVVIPGLTETSLTDKLIDVCELRGDAMAVIDLKYDYVPAHEGTETLPDLAQALTEVETRALNSSYAAAYYPAVYSATENVYLPASVAAIGVMGGTEGRSELWFAPAGFSRGGINQTSAGLSVSKAAIHLSSKDRDDLYNFNVNPIATFPREGVVIFGQKTLLAENSALNRINVRRLVNHIKRELSTASKNVLFEPNLESTWRNFKNQVEPFMDDLKIRFGLEDYRVELDSSTTTADLVDRNTMYAKVFIRPARTIEYVAIDLVITSSGVSLQ